MSKNPKTHKSLLIPAPLRNGDLVGVISASGPVTPDLLDEGIRFLEETGFRVKTGNYLYEKNDYFAGTDDQRSEDLNAMLRDPEVRGIFFARGGYGAMRLLDRLDGNSIVRDPTIVLGMSDVTALQLSTLRRFNLVTFSGPMVAGQIGAGLDEISKESFIQALTEPLNDRNLWPGNSSVRVLQEGSARGKLIGGCLSLVVALLGTPHIPDFTDSILFIEDVNEAAYRIDRMLTQLKLARILDKVAGLVLGHFLGPEGEDLGPEVDRIVMHVATGKRIPIISGFPHGHVLPNLTLPHGAPVWLDTDRSLLKVQLDLDSA